MNRGIINEIEISNNLNNKKIRELNPLEYDVIEKLYGFNLSTNEIIKCTVDKNKYKYDIIITYKNVNKYISIKMGTRNSVHVEHLYSFINFLRLNNISEDVIKSFIKYHYADGTLNNKGVNRISTEEFKIKYPGDIKKIVTSFANEDILYKFIDRFILQGLKADTPIDGLLYGTTSDFIFITRDEIIELFKYHFNKETTSVNVSLMYISPMARCINRNPKYEYCRLYIQVKWYNIFDDYIKFKTGY